MRLYYLLLPAFLFNCTNSTVPDPAAPMPTRVPFTGAPGEVRLITLDPGHFHAALIQRTMYPQIDSVVFVFAPQGDDLGQHLARIQRYNAADTPTAWEEEIYAAPDYLEQLMSDPPGNVVVLSGNNARKMGYIRASVDRGLNVLADKPMVIAPDQYGTLRATLRKAENKDLLVYDIMTERFEITSLLQRAFSRQARVFGALQQGSPEQPAISKESVHHFSKTVSGQPLIRPAWFFDVTQQGEGMVDVATHLVDLILWETFPDEPIALADVEVIAARRWPTTLSPAQFRKVTGLDRFPESLDTSVQAEQLSVYANGAFDFTVRGVHARVSVTWDFEAPAGAADTHYSTLRGSTSDLVIRQDKARQYLPTLYIEPVNDLEETDLQSVIVGLQDSFPGIGYRRVGRAFEITVPEELRTTHEDHFAQVTQQFLRYLVAGQLPEWERANLLTKYFVTTEAYRMSR